MADMEKGGESDEDMDVDRPRHRKIHPAEPIHEAHEVYDQGYRTGYYAARAKAKRYTNPYSQKESTMEGLASDKININLGEGGRGASDAGLAAVIAALGSRNQGNDHAALIAALGTRNEHRRDDDGFGFGGGGGILGLVALLGLLRGRGGLGGGDDCNNDGNHGRTAALQTLMEGQGDLRAQVPTIGLEIQNAICKSVAELALGVQQGFANTGDRIQASTYLLTQQANAINQNVSDQGCRTRDTVQNSTQLILSRIDGNRIAELEAQLARLHSHDHTRESEVRIQNTLTNTSVQQQQQQQLQGQFDHLFRRLGNIEFEQNQIAKNTNANLIIGSTGVATGAQSANPVNVR